MERLGVKDIDIFIPSVELTVQLTFLSHSVVVEREQLVKSTLSRTSVSVGVIRESRWNLSTTARG